MQAAQEPALTSVDDRQATRIELERKVAFRFENLEGFMTEYLLNLSATGMFIRCQDPQPKGSALDFEFSLADGEALISGYGEVMWARRRDGGPDKPAGMGVRFLHLDAETRELLRWFVTRRYITGGGPCDMEELQREMGRDGSGEQGFACALLEPPAPDDLPAAEREPQAPERPAVANGHASFREVGCAAVRSERRPGRRLQLAAALGAAALGAVYGLSRIAVPVAAWTNARAAAAPESAALPAVVPAPTPAANLAEASPEDPRAVERELAELTDAWAAAWSEQDVEAYLACYAAEFRPPDGRGRAAWEAQRRTRILKPRHIEVRLEGFAIERLEADRARVHFRQSYRSDRYRDVVDKTLDLVRADGAWEIVEERVGT